MRDPVAFRCKNCGHLLHAGHAGEANHPISCPVCKAGVEFSAADTEARDKLKIELTEAVGKKDEKAVDDIIKKLHNMPLNKTIKSDNWEVLAEASLERLKALGLDAKEVEKHTPFKTEWKLNQKTNSYEPLHSSIDQGIKLSAWPARHHERIAADSSATKDKSTAAKN